MSKLVPLGTHVVVTGMNQDDANQGNASGFIMPEKENEKPQKGKVVAVGPGTDDEKMHLKEGDVVIFKKYAPDEFEIDGEKYLVLKQSDVLAKLA